MPAGEHTGHSACWLAARSAAPCPGRAGAGCLRRGPPVGALSPVHQTVVPAVSFCSSSEPWNLSHTPSSSTSFTCRNRGPCAWECLASASAAGRNWRLTRELYTTWIPCRAKAWSANSEMCLCGSTAEGHRSPPTQGRACLGCSLWDPTSLHTCQTLRGCDRASQSASRPPRPVVFDPS